jgi:hypothetical protein
MNDPPGQLSVTLGLSEEHDSHEAYYRPDDTKSGSTAGEAEEHDHRAEEQQPHTDRAARAPAQFVDSAPQASTAVTVYP